jgi:hypothetical protein
MNPRERAPLKLLIRGERSDGLLGDGYLSPRSASAASIAWRSAAGLTARTTIGGLLRGRRA